MLGRHWLQTAGRIRGSLFYKTKLRCAARCRFALVCVRKRRKHCVGEKKALREAPARISIRGRQRLQYHVGGLRLACQIAGHCGAEGGLSRRPGDRRKSSSK